jgi:hypothetical protein
MKRWIIFLGRGGTVLISIGLALLLVSLIPSAQLIDFLPGSTTVPPKWAQPKYEVILTPQQGLRIELWANGTLDVYILEVSSQILYQWVGDDFLNVTDLEEFLEANPSVIGWSGEVRNGYIEHEHVPTKVTNATLVFSNPSSEHVRVGYDVSLMSRIVGIQVRNLSQWAIPIGFVLSLPWLTQMWKRKTRRKLS